MSLDLFKDILPAILQHKPEIFDNVEAIEKYNAFLINRGLSYYRDTIFYANQLNQLSNLDKDCQITFYINTIKANKRPWTKWSKPLKESDLEVVKMYFDYSDVRASEALKILTENQLIIIKERINSGE